MAPFIPGKFGSATNALVDAKRSTFTGSRDYVIFAEMGINLTDPIALVKPERKEELLQVDRSEGFKVVS